VAAEVRWNWDAGGLLVAAVSGEPRADSCEHHEPRTFCGVVALRCSPAVSKLRRRVSNPRPGG
jgi:hypothetical protein